MSIRPLEGQTALVTGGARGIGAAIAADLAQKGAALVICDIAPRESARDVIETITRSGCAPLYFEGDVGDRSSMEELFTTVQTTLGGIQILINNAAASVRKPLLDLDVTDVQRVWSVCLWGVFHCSQLAARRMVQQGAGGNIVSIGSVHAHRAFALSTAYNGAKAALNQMSRTWAAELAPHQIRVNVVEPGWIDTPGEREISTDEEIQGRGRMLPLGRLGKPEEVAAAVAFLVSPQAAYITGSCLRVDGGFVLPR